MISAVVISHRAGDHLVRCLGALERLRDEGLAEIIVVDNASGDGSPERVRQEFPQVRLLGLASNIGFGAANNRGAALAAGDRLLLINSDAWLESGSLRALDRALDTDPDLAAVAPRLHYPDGRPQFHWAPATGVLGEALQKLRNRFEASSWVHRPPPRWLAPWYSAACLLVRSRAFAAVGGFDPGYFLYFEDVDLCRRWRLAGWRVATAEDAIATHVKGGSQEGDAASRQTEGRAALEYRRSQLRYYSRHRPRWEEAVLRRRLARKLGDIRDPEHRAAMARLLDGS